MYFTVAMNQQDRGFSYSRTANPTVAALEAKVAGLEGAAGGACCVATGMAATVTVMSAFLKAGEPGVSCCYKHHLVVVVVAAGVAL